MTSKETFSLLELCVHLRLTVSQSEVTMAMMIRCPPVLTFMHVFI